MNYIQLINNAWELREQGILSAQEHDLYCYLVHKCNKLGWKNPFNQSTEIVCAVLGINRNGLTNRRNKLQQLGLIKFKEGITKRKPAEYMLCILKDTQSDTLLNTQGDTLGDTQPDTYTLNKTKLNKSNTPVSPELFPEEKPKKRKREKVEFIPPDIETVKNHFEQSKLPDWELQADLFFNHYDSLGWKNSGGVKVVNWDSMANKWILTEKQKVNETNKRNTKGSTSRKPEYGKD